MYRVDRTCQIIIPVCSVHFQIQLGSPTYRNFFIIYVITARQTRSSVSMKRAITGDELEITQDGLRLKKQKITSMHSASPSTYLKRFSCSFDGCDKAYTKPAKLADHERSHTGERPFCCAEYGCTKRFARKSHLQAHARSHLPKEERRYTCRECNKRFSTNQHLRQHLDLHSQPTPYSCEQCNASFHKNNQLKKHIASVHLHCKPCVCSETGCGKSFAYQSVLDKHSAKVHDKTKRYICEFADCQNQFTKWSMLQTHIKDIHKLKCRYCKKEYSDAFAYKLHVEAHEIPVEQRQTFACSIDECTKKFTRAHALKQHISVIHDGIRKYSCETCGKVFAYKKSLIEHVHREHLSGTDVSNETPDKVSKSKPTKSSSVLEKLTGVGYDQSGRQILCLVPGCAYRFAREYDLERHLVSNAHSEELHFW